MKKTTIINYCSILVMAALASACEIAGLEFQQDSEYNKQILDIHTDMDAWEFLNIERGDSLEKYPENDPFYQFKLGIAHAGLEEEYKKSDRTYFFITNNSIVEFTEGGNVREGRLFSTYLLADGDTAQTWQDYPVEQARDILLYHIFEGSWGYENLGADNTEVNTQLPGKTATMKLANDRNAKLWVNDFPFSARVAQARSSNLHTTNGVVHIFDSFIVPWTLVDSGD